jgi:hypothetical protein
MSISFRHFPLEGRIGENPYKGVLKFPKYPVQLKTISKEYCEDKLIEALRPFLGRLSKPLSQNNNIHDFVFPYRRFPYLTPKSTKPEVFLLTIKVNQFEYEYINLDDHTTKVIEFEVFQDENSLEVFYEFYPRGLDFRPGRKRSRSRYTIEDENFERYFFNSSLNSMARFLNLIIRDFSKIVMIPKLITNKDLGPVEELIAQGLGVSVLGYNQKK